MRSRRAGVYTLLLLSILTASLRAQAPAQPATANTVDRGVINGAPYYIEIPAEWNKGLVMYAHGYAVASDKPRSQEYMPPKALRDVFLSRGFAFAASDYSVAGLGSQGSHRGHRSAAPLLRGEARRAGRDLHHRPFDGRPHHDGDHRAISRGLSGRDADVWSAGGGGRFPQHRPLRHAGDVRGALSGHHRFTVRAQRRDGQQGESGGRGGPGARVEVRAALRPHGRAAARRARPLPPDRRRAEETCRRRAVRQS